MKALVSTDPIQSTIDHFVATMRSNEPEGTNPPAVLDGILADKGYVDASLRRRGVLAYYKNPPHGVPPPEQQEFNQVSLLHFLYMLTGH